MSQTPPLAATLSPRKLSQIVSPGQPSCRYQFLPTSLWISSRFVGPRDRTTLLSSEPLQAELSQLRRYSSRCRDVEVSTT